VVAELMRLHADLPVIDLDKLRARSFIDALVDARPNRLDERFRDSLAPAVAMWLSSGVRSTRGSNRRAAGYM
jgi:hypothetical protein